MKDNWRSLKIGEEINILSGYPFNSKLFNNEKEGKPLIRIRDILNSSIETFYSGPYLNLFVIKKDDILVGMDGEFHISKWNNIDALLNQRILKISQKNDAEIDIDYFYYYLFGFLKQIHNITPATTVKHLSTFDIKKAVASFPPVSHQRKIAKILKTADAVIKKTEAAIAKYRTIKQGMMQDLFIRGIDLQTGQLRPAYKVAPHLYKETELGWIPKEWEEVSFQNLIDKGFIEGIQDGNHGESHPKSNDFVSYGIPFVMANNIKNGEIDLSSCHHITEKQYNSLRIGFSIPGDVLLTHKGTVGLVGMVKEYTPKVMLTPQVTYYRCNKNYNELSNKYIYWYLQSPIYQSIIQVLSEQSTRKYIGITEQKKLKILIPPPKEQQSIVLKLSLLEKTIETESQNLRKQNVIKNGLMQDLLTGKVEVEI